ncbi:MAG: DUF4065 domain-containing protein [Fusobacterium necrophorum]|nr:DUF4065 domain-containing protein [Fusobacterium necrophorum]
MFDVMDLSWFILRRCADNGTPISNLQLQKILYFLQKMSLKNGNRSLFEDDIQAWQYGPVVPKVYKNFSFYSAMKIIPTDFDPMPKLEVTLSKELLQEIDKRATQNPWSLVQESHQVGGAWDQIFNDGYGNREVIPLELIQRC